ncbi:eukaryotic translation initiation factor 2D isoform X2 [Osmia lignaria lignaria]|uniref:eukaryotic translation initiation factor 2D isoform X2 n=1 Tax=Osmia lignaria lignaria TaxID=1437193 RepID=UPI0014782820|nr:eukaryotic translation initiation factor 2D isoform X2 [Osmia lignaria]
MFIKPFKVKSNNQLKGTERKKLCEEVLIAYPSLTEEEIQSLIPKKEAISVMKIVTHNGLYGKVYCTAKIPMFFQIDSLNDMLLPTIYTLWCHPNLLIAFTTYSAVILKLSGGADLMLPGVIVKEPVTLYTFGKLKKGTPVSVNTKDNKAPVAVGITALSSEDMYMSAGHGKCVEILHVIGDTLCQLGKPPLRPNLGPVNIDGDNDKLEDQINEETNDSNDESLADAINDLEINNDRVAEIEDLSEGTMEESKIEESEEIENITACQSQMVLDPVKEMDNLLEYCFLKACKTSVKSTDLPMLTSNFFKNHLIAVCPSNKNVDIKKSRYKKLSVFLSEMKEKGIIDTSVTKGVESILSIKFDHPLLRKLVILEERKSVDPVESNTAVVSECYKVTAAVLPVLSKFGYEKGDVMKRAEIRKCFTDYVKAENLQDGKTLKLNPQLAGIMKTKVNQETVTMEDGINKFIGRMTHMHEVTLAGNKLLHTGKLEPIDMRVTVRSGGKKVTLINNLETFGINSKEFSKECQNIGASATITDEPGKKTPSVLVQGNQILYVYKLLTEKYQIKKTYIRGLEFAPKKQGSHKK